MLGCGAEVTPFLDHARHRKTSTTHISDPNVHASVAEIPVTTNAVLPRGTIVIADDDAATLMLLGQVLSKAGFTVRTCENGQLACEAVRREKPDVVLIDWVMPVMDGRAAVANLKSDALTRGIPIIMLTSQAEISERVVALETGVQDFLTKPFDSRELIARIEQQMRWRKMLAVDANAAFMHDRLTLYRPEPGSSSSIFDRIWSVEPKQGKKRS